MSTFDKREDAYENKFAHDEELQFKTLARAHKLLGLWAAEKLGKSGAAADAYAKDLVLNSVLGQVSSGVVEKILKDFSEAGVEQSEHQIGRHLEEFRAQAGDDYKKA
ncbi:hypothetical protein CCR94_00240 [Rhodoblastus sphagnicola]|uniref:Aldolase n=1 Tax=Rhodoblastus sphagnicola TaxID=333368 RepID=A0A2S6NHF4_9HYPH|nr:DUF1476 domain-containing protein [Rhodoblastus sphagnicola]MBB4197081.1 hypothetical protein [Rhodoblastus sphagnicola]PPQ34043.1 hypothetical protein CCR94_00240 [Rhodoblastus sphagnicola]